MAGLTAPTLDIERKSPRLVAACAGVGKPRKYLTQVRKNAGVGCRVRARRAPDRRLVDADHFVDLIEAFNAFARSDEAAGTVQLVSGRSEQCVDNQTALARAAHPCHSRQHSQRQRDRDVFEVVSARFDHLERLTARNFFSLGDGQMALVRKVRACDRRRVCHQLLWRPLGHDLATMNPRCRPHVHYVISGDDGVSVVLDHQHAVALVYQTPHSLQ